MNALGFGVWCLGFGGLRLKVWGSEPGVQGLECYGKALRLCCLGASDFVIPTNPEATIRVQGLGFRVSGLGFWG